MATDLLNIDNLESVLRKPFNSIDVIDLSKFDLPSYVVPADHNIVEFNIAEKDYDSVIKKNLKKVMKVAEDEGFDRYKLLSPIFEACRNAHQHGNKYDSSKKIIVSYKIASKLLDISVIDEGGKINPNFFPYLLRHRQGLHRTDYVDFYAFCRIDRPDSNYGTGTTLMHSYVDRINYFKSGNGGLVVNFAKEKHI